MNTHADEDTKSPGQLAYEEDLRRQPAYPQSAEPRPSWELLAEYAQWTWDRTPTPRDWSTP